jgi:hypothetical protein
VVECGTDLFEERDIDRAQLTLKMAPHATDFKKIGR